MSKAEWSELWQWGQCERVIPYTALVTPWLRREAYSRSRVMDALQPLTLSQAPQDAAKSRPTKTTQGPT